ncbi:expressed unknown protein [Seminavis robusta]|uniref:Uncharacterized protein n=1 Tax=Seminavis robusta TaxID=568900 RepID=A0A9N8E091_9STRA|nr:expressed unknown protein [Seminavis robusta]|eukprot:Sro517_g158660.1 n/a (165) ;mRNA; r:28988-29711
MATNPMEEDSLIRALEDEQQFGVAPEAPPIPEEIIAQRNHSDDIETCVSSITDAIRDGELYVEPMYPVPEEGAPQPMVLDVAAERTHPHGNSKPSPRIVETNEQEVASLAATNPVEVAKGVHSAEIDKLSDEGEEDCKVEQPKAEEIVLGDEAAGQEEAANTAP